MIIIVTVIVTFLAVFATYLYMLYSGRVEDENKNYIPDSVEYRVKRLKEEIKDVKDAIEEVGNQLGDIPSALKGEARSGRKPNNK
jgi:flagellar basal body-associated protein FliL